MVFSWLMDNSNTDQRLEHHRNPPIIVPQEELYNNTGVEHFKIDPVSYKQSELLAKIRKERNYSYEDEIVCSVQCSEEFENKMKSFYTEHLHTDEEIRFVLEGSGYFDVRDADDQWIRIAVSAGDMIIIPAGIYHRFSLDMKNFIRVKRYFAGEPVWLPYNRPSDDMECRKKYLYSLSKRLAK